MAAGRTKALLIDAPATTEQRLGPLLSRAGWQVVQLAAADLGEQGPDPREVGVVILGEGLPHGLSATIRAWLGDAPPPLLVSLQPLDETREGSRDASMHCKEAETLAQLLEGPGAGAGALAGLAHDLRNALAPMRAALAILERADPQSTAGAAALAMLGKQLNLLNERINELSPSRAQPTRPTLPPPSPPVGRRILIADDSSAVQDAVGALLRSRGHTVRSAANGQLALELALEWQPDVVLADMRMPQLDGMGLARQLRARFARGSMKLILMSGLTLDPILVRHALAAGFDACIDKVAPPEQWFSEIGSG